MEIVKIFFPPQIFNGLEIDGNKVILSCSYCPNLFQHFACLIRSFIVDFKSVSEIYSNAFTSRFWIFSIEPCKYFSSSIFFSKLLHISPSFVYIWIAPPSKNNTQVIPNAVSKGLLESLKQKFSSIVKSWLLSIYS
jgi:hypothetical protein